MSLDVPLVYEHQRKNVRKDLINVWELTGTKSKTEALDEMFVNIYLDEMCKRFRKFLPYHTTPNQRRQRSKNMFWWRLKRKSENALETLKTYIYHWDWKELWFCIKLVLNSFTNIRNNNNLSFVFIPVKEIENFDRITLFYLCRFDLKIIVLT